MAKNIAKLVFVLGLILAALGIMSQFSVNAAPEAICTAPGAENAKAAYSREGSSGPEIVAIGEDNGKAVCGSGSHVAFDLLGNMWYANGTTLYKNGVSKGTLARIDALYAGNVTAVAGAKSISGAPLQGVVQIYDLDGVFLEEVDISPWAQGTVTSEDVFAQTDLLGKVTLVVAVNSGDGNRLLFFEDGALKEEFVANVVQIEPFGFNAVGSYDFLFMRGYYYSQQKFYKLNLGTRLFTNKDAINYGAIWEGIGIVNQGGFHYVQEVSNYLRTIDPFSMLTSSGATLWPYSNQYPFYPQSAATVNGNREAFLGFTSNIGLVHQTLSNEFPVYTQFDNASTIYSVATNPTFVAPEPPTPEDCSDPSVYCNFIPLIVR